MARLLREKEDGFRDLRMQLSSAMNELDLVTLRSTLSDIINEMSYGADFADIFPDMVKVCGTVDLVCKKLVYLYMSHYANQEPSLTLLTINSLHKDCIDPNPMLRGLALKTLCNIRLEEFLPYIKPPLLAAFDDKSSYVRQVALTSCLKVHSFNPEFSKANKLVDKIYELLLGDQDGIVVTHALCTLQEILQAQGGLTISRKIAVHLLNRLVSFTDWGKAYVLQVLLQYQPATEEEIFDIMNLLDAHLNYPNSGVTLAVFKLMLHLTNGMPGVQKDVLRKLNGVLLNLLGHEQPELVYVSLCHLQWLHQYSSKKLTKEYKKFFCRYSEPLYVKCKRVEILKELCTPSNHKEIIEELNTYCLDVSSELAQMAVEAMSFIAKKSKVMGELCFEMLIKLVPIERVSSLSLACMKDLIDIDWYEKFIPEVLDVVPSLWSSVDDARGKEALLWIIGQHGKDLSEAPYLLEAMIDRVDEERNSLLKCHLLTATTKLFFTRPAECQDMLGKLLEHCVEGQENSDLRDKGVLYYQLLQDDISQAKQIMFPSDRQSLLCPSHSPKTHTPSVSDFNTLGLLLVSEKWEQLQHNTNFKGSYSKKVPPLVNTVNNDPPLPQQPEEGQLVDLTGSHDNDQDVDQNVTKKEEEKLSMLPEESKIEHVSEEEKVADQEIVMKEVSRVEMHKDFQMTSAQFEELWTKLPSHNPLEIEKEVSNPSSFVSKWEDVGFHTMATTPEESQKWRAFVYAMHETSVFLVEINVNQLDKRMTIQTRCDGVESERKRAEHFLQQLIHEES